MLGHSLGMVILPSGVQDIPRPLSFRSLEYELFLRHLRAARENSGLTQEQVAARLGKPQSYISKTVNGERRMDLPEVVAFCEAIELPATEFVAGFVAALKEQQEPPKKPGTRKVATKATTSKKPE